MEPLPATPRNPDGAPPLARAARSLRVGALAVVGLVIASVVLAVLTQAYLLMAFAGVGFVLALGWAASNYAIARRVWSNGSILEGKAVEVSAKRVTVAVASPRLRVTVDGKAIEGASLPVLVDPAMPAFAGVIVGGRLVLGKVVR